MKLSIIIVNWNTRDLLARCLQSLSDDLAALQKDGVETFVVDNASNDGSVALLRKQFPWVQIIKNQKNVGFAGANNQAIRKSSGHYLLLLNPDTQVQTSAVAMLVEFMDMHPDVGATGSSLLNADGTLQISCFPAPTLTRELWRLLHLDRLYAYGSYPMQSWSPEIAREVDAVQGACLMVRRQVLEQVGAFDEDYFMYTEEIDLCYRIRQARWRICWVPTAQVVHYGGQSTRQVAAEMFLQLYLSKLMYFRKNQGFLAAYLYKLILFVTGLARLLLSPIARFEQPSRRQQHEALASNYRRLLHALSQM